MTQISTEKFDAELRSTFVEVSSAALGGRVLSCSDDFFASKDNLIKPSPSISLKGQFGPNGALYDGWESRRHNVTYDWVIIRLAPLVSTLHYVDIDTSHFKGNEAPNASVFALRLASEGAQENVKPNDPRWREILPVVELGPDSRHIFELGKTAQGGEWSMVMVRMIPDGGMARFRAFGRPVPPTPLKAIPAPGTAPINLLSPLLGAHIVSCSDANFSPPGNLLLPGRGVDMSDGWETRRSQEGRGKYAKGGALEGQERREWVVAKLAGTGLIKYVEVDTAFHPGNYPVACKVEATLCEEVSPPDNQEWTTIVTMKHLGPHRQHWFDIARNVAPEGVYSHVRLSIYPDGGVKRFRVYGHPLAPSTLPATPSEPLTIPALPLTAEAFERFGDVIQGYSLPTSAPKSIDVTLANQGTAFKFNRLAPIAETYPAGMLKGDGLAIGCVRGMPFFDTKNGAVVDVKMLERHACTSQAFIPMGKGVAEGTEALPSGGGFVVVAALNGKDDKPDLSTLRAFLATAAQGVNIRQGIWHHHLWTVDAPMDYACVEAQIGTPGLVMDCEIVKPVDVFCKVSIAPYSSFDTTTKSLANGHAHPQGHPEHHGPLETLSHLLPALPPAIEHSLHADTLIHPTPITPEAFAPFGNLIFAYPDEATRPGGMIVTGSLKTGKAEKYTRLAHILSTYPPEAKAQTAIGVYRATKKIGLERGKVFDIRFMERHPYTTQAFIPMGKATWEGYGEEALPKGGAFLVVVAKNGPDDRPDPSSVKSFIMESSMGLSYAAGTWHHPVLVLDSTLDLACVETQIHTGLRESDPRDCELLTWDGEEVLGRIAVPKLEV